MKKNLKSIIAVILLISMLVAVTACGRNDDNNTPDAGRTTPNADATPGNTGNVLPSPNETVGTIESHNPTDSDAPTASSEPTRSDEPIGSNGPIGSSDPAGSENPGNTDSDKGDITGFVEGEVIDEDDAPEVVSAVTTYFPGYEIQSITFDRYEGRQAYKVTLQGDGELAKNIFVLGDGTIVMPAEGD